MVIMIFPEFEICGSVQGNSKPCKSSQFSDLPSEQGFKLTECKKCGNVKDIGLRTEDEKHRIYHEKQVEPDDKQNITENKK